MTTYFDLGRMRNWDSPLIYKNRKVGFFLLVFTALFLSSFQQAMPSKEYQIKAVFLFNFTQFVEWPADAFSTSTSPLVIGVLGEDPFGNYLEETVSGEQINGHPLIIQRYGKVDDIKTCHILFINVTYTSELKRAFESLRNQHTLTVGDDTNFSKLGGMIRFFTADSKTRIRINLEATKEANLVISSKLLRLADVVGPLNN